MAAQPSQTQTQTIADPSLDATYGGIAMGFVKQILDGSLERLKQQNTRMNIHNYEKAGMAYAHNQFMAGMMGLSDGQRQNIMPYPDQRGNNNVTVVQAPQQQTQDDTPIEPDPEPTTPAAGSQPTKSLFSKALPWLLGGTIGAGGVGAGAVLNDFLQDKPQPDQNQNQVIDYGVDSSLGMDVK